MSHISSAPGADAGPPSAAPRLHCITCPKTYALDEVSYRCDCGALLEVHHDPAAFRRLDLRQVALRSLNPAPADRSGVWRFREVVLPLPVDRIVTHPEGGTHTYARPSLAAYCGIERVTFKHEGENPTGSFKDRGMTVAITQAQSLGMRAVGCASTGNTSAALAAYAAQAGMQALVFIPSGKIALGKLAQSIGYGATCLAVRGDFDTAMSLVQEAAATLGIYLVNSLNPFRLEGQKTIIWELLQDRGWVVPDWIVVPAGNLGNVSAFGKALREAHAAGWIDRLPRLAAIQATGANPFYESFTRGFASLNKVKAETVATAIRIGDPVNFAKAKGVITGLGGVVAQVDDAAIMAAKRAIDRAGIGCEPASACALAGAKLLRELGVIKASDDVVGILTGHMLKDPDAVLGSDPMALVREIDPDIRVVERLLRP